MNKCIIEVLSQLMDNPDDSEAVELACESDEGVIDQDDGSNTRKFTCTEVGCLVVCNLTQYCYEGQEESGSILRKELPDEKCILKTSIQLPRGVNS